MGRHGGGSRSGGRSSGSRSGSGSRSSRNTIRTSKTPFKGSYRRCYYRGGRQHYIYTNNAKYGTKSGWNFGNIFALIFITFHMFGMILSMLFVSIDFGSKLDGDRNFICIEDNIDELSYEEEDEIIKLFEKIFDKTGMPIMLYTDNYDYKNYYLTIENYSEDLYYSRTMAEDSMVILFTRDKVPYGDGWTGDWTYDFYCGDDTVRCLSDAEFEKLLNNFQKMMYREDLEEALKYCWNSVYDDLAETEISLEIIFISLILVLFYGLFYFAILSGVLKQNAVYKYYKEHPEELSMKPYDGENNIDQFTEVTCTFCGAKNFASDTTCRYCGTKL